MNRRIVIISDRRLNASMWQPLEAHGFDVTVAENADDGYARLTAAQVDLVVIDLEHPVESAGIIKWIRAHENLRAVSILAVAEWGTGGATMALAQGTDAFETAPIDPDRLLAAVRRVLLPRIVMTAKAGGRNGDAQD